MPDDVVTIRSCHTIEEFERMVELEIEVWKFVERDIVPSQMYVVASKIGGQVLGAFVRETMAGFILAYPGIRDGSPYLHYHMAAVEWTFDPLQTRNAYLNICRLGAVARRYLTDVYGATSSPLHAGLPTDRLVAEWHLESQRVSDILAGKEPVLGPSMERVRIVMDEASPGRMAKVQAEARERFQELFAAGYVATWFEREAGGGSYILAKP
jgi:predicted GNAT superfamily acetyltransferase